MRRISVGFCIASAICFGLAFTVWSLMLGGSLGASLVASLTYLFGCLRIRVIANRAVDRHEEGSDQNYKAPRVNPRHIARAYRDAYRENE